MTNEELVAKIQAGDDSLQEQLWLQVKRWIYKLANQFFTFNYDLCTTLSLDLDDFIQEAYFAMLDAICIYKQDGGSKFSTVLTWRVKKVFKTLPDCVFPMGVLAKVTGQQMRFATQQVWTRQAAKTQTSISLLLNVFPTRFQRKP